MAGISELMLRLERRLGSEWTPAGILIGVGVMAVLAALIVAAFVPASAGIWRVAPVALVLAVFAALTVNLGAVAFVATLAYLLVEGFLVNRYGVLSWHGIADVYLLLVIVISAGAGLVVGAVRRRSRPLTVPPEWIVVTPADSRPLSGLRWREALDREPTNKHEPTNKEEVRGG